jgi:phage terminase small subunit
VRTPNAQQRKKKAPARKKASPRTPTRGSSAAERRTHNPEASGSNPDPATNFDFEQDDEAPLTEKQRRFVDAYLGEAMGNATQACALAGYQGDRSTLGVTGHWLLRNPKVRAAIDSRIASDPGVATREERQRLLTDIARGVEQPAVFFGRKVMQPPSAVARIRAMDLMSKMAGEQRVTLDLDAKEAPTVTVVLSSEAPAT